MFLLHCSDFNHPEGRILTARPELGYGHDHYNQKFFQFVEMFRPSELIAHMNAVYMVDNKEDLDKCGGNVNYVFVVRPEQPVSRHDMNWITEIFNLLQQVALPSCAEDADVRLVHAAQSYWAGLPHPDGSIWEYLASSAEVLLLIHEDDCVDRVLSEFNRKSDPADIPKDGNFPDENSVPEL